MNPTLQRLEERIAPGLCLPAPTVIIGVDLGGGGDTGGCGGAGGGSSANDSHSSKTNSTKGTNSGTCHCDRHSH